MVGRTPAKYRVAARDAAALALVLRRRREDLQWSRDRLGRTTGLSVATVRAIETGRVREPGFFTVLAMAHALGLGLSELSNLTGA
ncbi:helix-turn-helix domain-containing protein [Mycolicibacterium senegalense]|uniref:helix-turn-helix domain-containing protein n=1 Tax=Mycolicibacterium senegalense TaxID=1796 RepID=UPI003AAA8D2D